MRLLARATPLVVALLAATACGNAREDPRPATARALDCIVEHTDGTLTLADRTVLSDNFEWQRSTETYEDGSAEDAVPQTLALFNYLTLDRDEAEALYAAANQCGVDFRSILAGEASKQIPNAVAGTPEAAACVAEAASEENVHEYVLALLTGREPSTLGSQYALWRTLNACAPRQTLATAPDFSTEETEDSTDPTDHNGYFDPDDDETVSPPTTNSSEEGNNVIQDCLDFVDDQASEIVAMLNEGLISEADYERLMLENSDQSQNCLDLR